MSHLAVGGIIQEAGKHDGEEAAPKYGAGRHGATRAVWSGWGAG
jgi:hypothetical protein